MVDRNPIPLGIINIIPEESHTVLTASVVGGGDGNPPIRSCTVKSCKEIQCDILWQSTVRFLSRIDRLFLAEGIDTKKKIRIPFYTADLLFNNVTERRSNQYTWTIFPVHSPVPVQNKNLAKNTWKWVNESQNSKDWHHCRLHRWILKELDGKEGEVGARSPISTVCIVPVHVFRMRIFIGLSYILICCHWKKERTGSRRRPF